jgi:hypothetical protein
MARSAALHRGLIRIKALPPPFGMLARDAKQPKEEDMPLETVVVVVGVFMLFATFAAVLNWAERRTGRSTWSS